MQIEIAQLDLKLGEKEENLKKVIGIIKKSDSNLILFPELFTSGFDFPNLEKLAEGLDGKTVKAIQEGSRDKLIAGSIVERNIENPKILNKSRFQWESSLGDRIYNTFLLINKEGIIAKYRKIHLFRKEKEFFSAGEKAVVADTALGRIALATCYDLRFPELFRKFIDAELVLVCANFPRPRDEHWLTLLRARAIENQFFVCACNRVGSDRENEYFGKSMVMDPWGKVIASAGEGEEIVSCEINLNDIEKIRKEFPVLEDIRLR